MEFYLFPRVYLLEVSDNDLKEGTDVGLLHGTE
jgi:hypothetical protein